MYSFFCQKNPNNIVPCGEKEVVQFHNHFLSLREDEKDKVIFLRKLILERGNLCSFKEITPRKITDKKFQMNILVQRLGGLGDILFATPVIQYLHSLGHNVNFFLHFGYWEALVGNPHINKIYCTKEGLERENRPPVNGVYPEAITPDIFANHDKTCVFQGAIEHNKNAEEIHAIDAYYKWIDIDPKDKPKEIVLNITEQEKHWGYKDLMKRGYNPNKPFISVSPNASWAKNRSWPISYFQKLKAMLQKDYNVVYIHRDEGWTLRQMFSIIYNMDLCVTVDTGVLHVAGALGKPIIALFGSFNPDLRVRYYKNCEVVCKNPRICGKFCFSHGDQCEYTYKRLATQQRLVKSNWQAIYPPCLTAIKPEEIAKRVKERCVSA